MIGRVALTLTTAIATSLLTKSRRVTRYNSDATYSGATFFRFSWPLEIGKKWTFERTGTAVNQVGGEVG